MCEGMWQKLISPKSESLSIVHDEDVRPEVNYSITVCALTYSHTYTYTPTAWQQVIHVHFNQYTYTQKTNISVGEIQAAIAKDFQ